MLAVTVVFKVKADAVEDFRKAVLLQAKTSLKKEKACRRFDVCFDDDRSDRVFLYEVYDDKAAFDLHVASDHFKNFNEVSEPMLEGRAIELWSLQSSK